VPHDPEEEGEKEKKEKRKGVNEGAEQATLGKRSNGKERACVKPPGR